MKMKKIATGIIAACCFAAVLFGCGGPPIHNQNNANENTNSNNNQVVTPEKVAVVKNTSTATIRLATEQEVRYERKPNFIVLEKDKEVKVKLSNYGKFERFQIFCEDGYVCPLDLPRGAKFLTLREGDSKSLHLPEAEFKIKPNFHGGYTTKTFDVQTGELKGDDYNYVTMSSGKPGELWLDSGFCSGGALRITKVSEDYRSFEAESVDKRKTKIQVTVLVQPTAEAIKDDPRLAKFLAKYPKSYFVTGQHTLPEDNHEVLRWHFCLLQPRKN